MQQETRRVTQWNIVTLSLLTASSATSLAFLYLPRVPLANIYRLFQNKYMKHCYTTASNNSGLLGQCTGNALQHAFHPSGSCRGSGRGQVSGQLQQQTTFYKCFVSLYFQCSYYGRIRSTTVLRASCRLLSPDAESLQVDYSRLPLWNSYCSD